MKRNQSGFSIVEIIMAIVIVGLLGALGWMYWTNVVNKKDDTNANVAKTATKTEAPKATSTPAALKTYKLKTQPLEFNYPSSWSTQTSLNTGKGSVDSESVEVSSPDGFTLALGTFGSGLGGTGPCDRNITEFKFEGDVDKSLNSNDSGIVSYTLDNERFVLNIAGKTLSEAMNDCRGYAELINLGNILTDSDRDTYKATADNLVFGTNVLFQSVTSTTKPSDTVYKEAVAILKSLRKS